MNKRAAMQNSSHPALINEDIAAVLDPQRVSKPVQEWLKVQGEPHFQRHYHEVGAGKLASSKTTEYNAEMRNIE